MSLLRITASLLALALIGTSLALIPARRATPDSGWLAYTDADHHGVYRVRVDGAGTQRINRVPLIVEAVAWSPDGRQIAVQAVRPTRDHTTRVYQMRVDGRDFRPATNLPNHIRQELPAWASDGAALYLIVDDGRTRNLMRVDGSGTVTPRTDFRVGGGVRLDAFSLAPDDERVLLHLRNIHEEARGSIVLLAADGGAAVTLHGDTPGANTPSWSPDGERVLFYGAPGATYGLYEIALPDGEAQRLHEVSRRAKALYSPDGRWLLIRPIPTADLMVMSTDHRRTTLLTSGVDGILDAQWSAGGGWIAFGTLSQQGDTALSVIRRDGTARRQVAANVKPYSFVWSPVIDRAWSPEPLVGAGGLLAVGVMGGSRLKHRLLRRHRATPPQMAHDVTIARS